MFRDVTVLIALRKLSARSMKGSGNWTTGSISSSWMSTCSMAKQMPSWNDGWRGQRGRYSWSAVTSITKSALGTFVQVHGLYCRSRLGQQSSFTSCITSGRLSWTGRSVRG